MLTNVLADGRSYGCSNSGLEAIHPIVNSHRGLRTLSSLTEWFIMYLNGIKRNVVTNLNPLTWYVCSYTHLLDVWTFVGYYSVNFSAQNTQQDA